LLLFIFLSLLICLPKSSALCKRFNPDLLILALDSTSESVLLAWFNVLFDSAPLISISFFFNCALFSWIFFAFLSASRNLSFAFLASACFSANTFSAAIFSALVLAN